MTKHTIPLGTLVEIKFDPEMGDQKDDYYRKGIRMFVVKHSFDCDGSPLYDLSFDLKVIETLEEIEKELQETVTLEQSRDSVFLMNRAALETIKQWNIGRIDRHYNEESLIVIE